MKVVDGYYKHFKGTVYKVFMVGEHSETGEKMVVYAEENGDKFYIRPLDMFTSKVDKEKYPDVKQEYRFEYVGGGLFDLNLADRFMEGMDKDKLKVSLKKAIESRKE